MLAAGLSCYDRDNSISTVLLCVSFDSAKGTKKMEHEGKEERFCLHPMCPVDASFIIVPLPGLPCS